MIASRHSDVACGPLPGNPIVFVQPYAPPTAEELELSRKYYAARQ